MNAQSESDCILVAVAVGSARAQLDHAALNTDIPQPPTVGAADLLDTLRDAQEAGQ